MRSLDGHILITGAAGGIGRALAQRFASSQTRLTLADQTISSLSDLPRVLPGQVRSVDVDLADLGAADRMLAQAEAQFGPVDVLVNNAGIQYVCHTTSVTHEEEQRIAFVNWMTPARLMRAVLPAMLRNRAGLIVNVSSIAGVIGVPWMFHYSSTKAALGVASEILRLELRGSGVHVLTVYPGSIATPMGARSKQIYDNPLVDRSPTASPEDLAEVVYRAAKESKPRVVYPQVYKFHWYLRGLMTWFTWATAPRPKHI